MPPTRVQSIAPAASNYTATAGARTSAAFTVQAGDLIVVFGDTGDAANLLNTPTASGGSVVWTLRQSYTTSGDCAAYCWTGAVGAGASITVSVTATDPTGIGWGWTGSLYRNHGGVGVSGKAQAVGAPAVNLTVSARSAVEFGSADYVLASGTRTWRTVDGAPMSEASYDVGPTFLIHYHGYDADLSTAGTYTFGLSAPTGQQYSATAVEILTGASATTSVSKSLALSWKVAATVSKSLSTSWVTRQAVAKSLALSWNVFNANTVTSTHSTTWNVGGRVSKSLSLQWNTAAQVSRSWSTQWNVLRTVSKPLDLSWNVFSFQSTVASVRPGMRLRVYLPNGADQGILPTPSAMSAAYPLNDVGALTFDYAVRAPRSSLLGQPCEVAVEFSPDNGVTWVEPDNSRFRYLADAGDPLDLANKYGATAKGYLERLSTAQVLPRNLLNADGKRAFLSAKPGLILKTLLNEAQADGFLTGLDHSSFTTIADSAGVVWANTITIYYEPGINYLAVLQDLADQGFVDFKTNGRSLYVYNADSALAVDRTVTSTQVTLRAGRDVTEAPFRRTWENLASFAFVAGADGATYSFTNAQASAPWGKQGVFISNGSVSDQGTMAALAQNELSQREQERVEYTRGLDFTRAVHRPFFDYFVGDYVWSATGGADIAKLRVRQFTLAANERGIVTGNITLNDRFVEADLRAARRISGITNGAQSGPGTGGPPPGTPSEADKVAPGPVTGLLGSSSAYLGPGGFAQAQVTLSWAAPATNTDGTPFEDFDHYEVWQRAVGSVAPQGAALNDLRMVGTTTDTTWSNSPYIAGSTWWFTVRVADTSGNRSAFAAEKSVGMANDATPPQAPSTPILTQDLGIVRIYWDGLPATGSWAADFDHVEVHTSLVNNFTPADATWSDTLYGEGPSILTGLAYDVPVFAKLIAVDKAGNKSVASAQGTATPTRLVNTDLIDDIVDARLLADGAVGTAAIANLAVGTANMKDLSVVTAKIGDLAVNDAKISALSVGKLTAGTLSSDVLVAARLMTASSGSRVEMSGTGIRMYNGTTVTGHWNPSVGQLRIYNSTDASHTSTGHGIQFGDDTGQNLIIDNNEILARNNGTYGTLLLNREGGPILIGGKIGGFAGDGSDTGQFPQDTDHTVVVRAQLHVYNTSDGEYADEFPPFMIGRPGGLHLWMDSNEIGATSSTGDAVGTLVLQGTRNAGDPNHTESIKMASNSFAVRRYGSYNSGTRSTLLYGLDGINLGIRYSGNSDQFFFTDGSGGALKPIEASNVSFTSARTAKHNIQPIVGALSAIKAAPSSRWQYLDDVEQGKRWHVGPMFEDLPPEVRMRTGNPDAENVVERFSSASLPSMVGYLWEAVRQLSGEVDALKPKGPPVTPGGPT